MDHPECDPSKIKEIIGFSDDEVGADDIMLRLAAWMHRYYGSTMISALRTVIPVRKKMGTLTHRYVSLRQPLIEAREFYNECVRKHQVARARLLSELLANPKERIPYELVSGKLNVSSAVIRSLQEKGVIRVDSEAYYRNPVGEVEPSAKTVTLSEDQKAISERVIGDYDKGIRDTYLIHGITGSGKTEVYIDMIDKIIKSAQKKVTSTAKEKAAEQEKKKQGPKM